jgi:hypothetical protein
MEVITKDESERFETAGSRESLPSKRRVTRRLGETMIKRLAHWKNLLYQTLTGLERCKSEDVGCMRNDFQAGQQGRRKQEGTQ